MDTAVLILAAGTSRRMGSIKQLLPWKSSNLLTHTVQQAIGLDTAATFVVLGAHYETIKTQIVNLPVNILYHKNWNEGMGTSLTYGLSVIAQSDINYKSVLILLCDQPLIDTLYLKQLLKTEEDHPEKIIASFYKEGYGVPVIFPKKYFKDLLKLNGDKGAKKIILKFQKEVITINGQDQCIDVDTPKSYKALYKKLH